MKNLIAIIALALTSSIGQAEILNIKSTLYRGQLNQNGHPGNEICYVQINDIKALPEKGQYCNLLNIQMMFNLDDKQIHERSTEILMTSRKTNTEHDFHKPTTCAEVTSNIETPWIINKWGEDTAYLYNQVFNAKMKASKGENHYTLIFNGNDKTPERAMIHNVQWFSENSYECTGLKAL